MKRGRIAILSVVLVMAAVPVVYADGDCGPDEILAASNADTIFVEHFQAFRNCCTDLTVEVQAEQYVANFYEGDAGDWCFCMCCFNLDYNAHGFAAGHYIVRVWNEDGSVLYGETEVDVEGAGATPVVGLIDRGDCMQPGAVEEPTQIPTTWGRLRAAYR